MGDILVCDTAGKHFEDCYIHFKKLCFDKNSDVRSVLYQKIFDLLTNFNIIYLRKFEHQLSFLLLNGLSDEKETIIQSCFEYLNKGGEYRKVNSYFYLEF